MADTRSGGRAPATRWLRSGIVALVLSAAMAAPALGQIHAAHSLADVAQRADDRARETLAKNIVNRPGYAGFLADPVWNSPSWAAIAAAQDEDNEQLYSPAAAEMRAQAEDALWPTRPLLTDSVDNFSSYLLTKAETAAPLTHRTERVAAIPVTAAFILGKQACESGAIPGYLNSRDPDSLIPVGQDGSSLRAAWTENGKTIIAAASRHACSKESL